jgi:GNAT superfamily N-acetyltransferase
MTEDLRIREMTLADCRPVAEIRVRGWQATYAGMVPQAYLDALDVEADAERRRGFLAHGRPEVVNLVAERDGEVVGWACHGPYRDETEDDTEGGDDGAHGEDVELYAIYVHGRHLSTGVGGALLTESVRRCAAAGRRRMLLWVLKENLAARRFYERHGFAPDGAEAPFDVDGVPVPEIRCVRSLDGA